MVVKRSICFYENAKQSHSDLTPFSFYMFVLLRFHSVFRIYVERIHGVGTTPSVSQGFQTKGIDAVVALDFMANTAKVQVICSSTIHTKLLLNENNENTGEDFNQPQPCTTAGYEFGDTSEG